MKLLHLIADVFLWPGDLVRRTLGINIEEDGSIIRSFVNMTVWGIISVIVVIRFYG